jgi:putative acetyltransferase
MIEIRKETEKDYGEVIQIVSEAFGNEAEARLVEKLRKIPHISMIALLDGKIIGHICFSPVSIENAEQTNFLGLAPMAVSPEFQNQGIGSKLIREALKVCTENGHEAIFVLGHPDYYPRFGFEIAKPRGFTCEYPVKDEHFMVLELKQNALKGKQGLVKYSDEFAEF